MAKEIKKWKLLNTRTAFEHRWYKLECDTVEVRPGKIFDDYFVGVFKNIVLVVAITAKDEVILIKQYKHGAGKILLEVPAGYIDGKESPLKAAQRELMEETGYKAFQWMKLGFYHSNPTKERGNNLHIFLAKNAVKVRNQKLDETEDIEIKLFSRKDVLKMIRQNKIEVVGSAFALLFALGNKKPRSR